MQKQNQEKKKRSCTRGFPVVACQRYLRLDWRTFSNLPSLFLIWGPFSSSECNLRACSSVSFMRCISTGWRQSSPRTRSLTEPITSIEAATVRRSLRFIFLPASSLASDFRFPEMWLPIPDVQRISSGYCYQQPILLRKEQRLFFLDCTFAICGRKSKISYMLLPPYNIAQLTLRIKFHETPGYFRRYIAT